MCTINTVTEQITPTDMTRLVKESQEDDTISRVMKYTREGWPSQLPEFSDMAAYKQFEDSLSTSGECLIYGQRVVIPPGLRRKTCDLLHLGHLCMEKMKYLA